MSYIASSLLRYLFNRSIEYGINYYTANREQINQNIRDTIITINTFNTVQTNINNVFHDIYEEYNERYNNEEYNNEEYDDVEVFKGCIITKHDIDPGSTCAICLDSYEDHDEIALSNCKHNFHLECIEKWMFQQRSCPICRGVI